MQSEKMPKLASPARLPGATSPLEANLHRPMDRRETQWVPLWMFQSLAATPVIFAPPAVDDQNTHIKIHTSSCAMMLLRTTCCRHLQHTADTCITKHAKTSIQQNSIRMQTRQSPAFLLHRNACFKSRGPGPSKLRDERHAKIHAAQHPMC